MNQPPLELRSSLVSGVLLIDAAGEIDMATAPEMTAAIQAVASPTTRVVVNLSEVTFLDSSALNALVVARRELDRRGVTFRVISPTDMMVRRVLEITHLTAELGVVDSLDDALA